jgi:hypothetical protein
MLQWNDLHPYNAVNVLRIYESFEFEKLRRAVNTTLEAQGLTGLSLDRSRGTYRYEGGPARCEIKLINDENPQSALASQIERQLNSAFLHIESFDPFRFFVVPDGNSFSLGICWFHPIADVHSIVRLTRDIFARYGGREPGCRETFDLYPGRYSGPLSHPALLVRRLASLPSYVRNMHTSYRVPFRDIDDSQVRYTPICLGSEKLHCLVKTARSWDLTVNDLLLALTMKCLPLLCWNPARQNRPKISIGNIVNTRNDLRLGKQHKFGVFLGSFVVSHEVPEGASLMDLARDIRRQTLAIKKDRLYLATTLDLAFGRFMLSFFSTKRKKKFYQKYYPLLGGITNINLNSLWEQQPGERPIDFFRAVSPGPTTPFILNLTTVREAVNISMTWRPAFFTAKEIQGLKDRFFEALNRIACQ